MKFKEGDEVRVVNLDHCPKGGTWSLRGYAAHRELYAQGVISDQCSKAGTYDANENVYFLRLTNTGHWVGYSEKELILESEYQKQQAQLEEKESPLKDALADWLRS